MNQSQAFYYYSSFMIMAFQITVQVPACIMAYVAVSHALRRGREDVLKWLRPVTLVQTVALIYYVYGMGFRLLHIHPSLASTLAVYGFVVVGGFLSLYSTWRVLGYVRGSVTSAGIQEGVGVWPPPPSRGL